MLKRQGREVGEGEASSPGVGEVEQEWCKKQGIEVGGVEEEESKVEQDPKASERDGITEQSSFSIEQESERDCEKRRLK